MPLFLKDPLMQAEDQLAPFGMALACLAAAFQAVSISRSTAPVIVGGAAVVILTAGTFFSGDFDFVHPDDAAISQALLEHGFVEERRPGMLRIGWYHPEHPGFGFQQVSGTLFDGRSERSRQLIVGLPGGGEIRLPAVEDMIADRLGQHSVASPTDRSRLDQARVMLALSEGIDPIYLRRRIEDEGGDPALLADIAVPASQAGVLDLEGMWARAAARRAALGITGDWDERMRNRGGSRTPEKQALLQGMQDRGRNVRRPGNGGR